MGASRKEGTAERILDAARSLAADRGFAGTTTKAIAQRAGVNEVTLFRLFGGKEALLEAAVVAGFKDQAESPMAAALETPVRGLSEAVAMVSGFARAFAGVLSANRELIFIALKESASTPALGRLLGERGRSLAGLLAARLAPLEARGILSTGSAKELASALVDATIGAFLMASLPKAEGEPVRFDPGRVAGLLLRGAACREGPGARRDQPVSE